MAPDPVIQLRSVVLDCPDPPALARFYAELLGGALDVSDPDWCEVRPDGSTIKLAFQRVASYVPPSWPDGAPQQVHLDLTVDDPPATSTRAVALGARVLSPPVDGPGCTFIVHADPVGHPFCLCHER
jgi:predicted enzyme related to lactoylglutathione lyase